MTNQYFHSQIVQDWTEKSCRVFCYGKQTRLTFKRVLKTFCKCTEPLLMRMTTVIEKVSRPDDGMKKVFYDDDVVIVYL